MPLLAGPVVTPPTTEPPPLPILTPPAEVGRARATWFPPDGGEWLLDVPDLGWMTPDEVSGLGAAPITLVTDPHPRGGTRVRHIQPLSRIITWPLVVAGLTHEEFVALWRALARAFTQTRRLGAGLLRIARPDGTAREIQAYYEAGFDGEPSQGHTWDTVVLSLFCEDPYWRDVTATTVRREHQTGAVDFLAPYPTVASAQVLGETTIDNPGEVEAWPSWVITGPATEVTATNTTTGDEFVLTYTLTAGQTITITTDPPTVRGPAGQVLTSALNWPGATLWALQPGTNDVEFTASGAAAGTSIELTFYPRYETA